ncbi:MBL fold metallo-hydrolase [Halalkalicoccus salilacus]|uniref:MBL fold metallo-hydrolase n=1 Tax=Halalkalicoccus salilacus TaxID=3117459 RepID=UPI0038D38093
MESVLSSSHAHRTPWTDFKQLGHASIRIETEDGSVIYIDPWTEVLDGEPGDGNVVFVTHDDFDHYDPNAIDAVAKPDATVAVYEAVDTADFSFEVVDLSYEGEATIDDIDVRSVPAYNDPDSDHVDDDGDPFHADGEVIGLLLTIEGTIVFFSSDTDFLPHHESIDAEVFIPPIGGHFTMDRHEAAEFARSVDPDLVLPVHYDTFDPIETDAAAFADELEDEGVRVELF